MNRQEDRHFWNSERASDMTVLSEEVMAAMAGEPAASRFWAGRRPHGEGRITPGSGSRSTRLNSMIRHNGGNRLVVHHWDGVVDNDPLAGAD
jgi:hypothetical protein